MVILLLRRPHAFLYFSTSFHLVTVSLSSSTWMLLSLDDEMRQNKWHPNAHIIFSNVLLNLTER